MTNSIDYIELSINTTDEPPDSIQLEKNQEYKATTALLTDLEQNDSTEEFIVYDDNESKKNPEENTLAIQVRHHPFSSPLFF